MVEPTPLKSMKVSWDDDIPNIWKNGKCSKPPTRIIFDGNLSYFMGKQRCPSYSKKQTKVGTSSISRARHGNFMKQPRIFPNTSCWTQPQTWRYTPKSSLYRWIVHYQLTIHFNRIFPYKPSILIGCSWIFPQKPSIFGVSPLKKTQSAGSSLPDQCTYLVVLAHAPAAARAGTYGKPRVVTSRFNGFFSW